MNEDVQEIYNAGHDAVVGRLDERFASQDGLPVGDPRRAPAMQVLANDALTTAEPHVRVGLVIETLRFLADGWVGDVTNPDDSDRKWLRAVAEQLALAPDPSTWGCCPLCEETVCDTGCPLATLTAYRARAPKGHPGYRAPYPDGSIRP